MNITSLSVFLICCLQNLFCQTWVKLSDFPASERDDGAKFSIANKVYCGSGLQVGWTCTNDFYAFDLITESWSVISPMATTAKRQYGLGFSLLGKGYIFGGVNDGGVYLNDLWEYNPTTDTWVQKADMPALGRAGAVAFVVNDVVYVVGGRTSLNNAVFETWSYNSITDSWTQLANLPISGVWRGVAFNYNNLGYVGLGRNNLDQFNKQFFEFNLITNSWRVIEGYIHSGRAYTGHAQIGKNAYLFGGVDTLGVIDNSFERLDLSDFTTHVLSPFLSTARKGCMSFIGNNAFYLTTGVSTTARFNETWKAVDIVSVKEFTSNNSETLIYPNPATSTINILTKKHEVSFIKIVDLFGREVLMTENTTNNIDISTLEKGNYILIVELKNFKKTFHKLIIE